ncbi:MAG: hypothetical protein ABI624_17635 [Casimicrobiaceae bacterium]
MLQVAATGVFQKHKKTGEGMTASNPFARVLYGVRRAIAGGCACAACGMASAMASANNGLNMIGFGAESIGMGGADIAVARDTGPSIPIPPGSPR